jgi:hypothetical protein
MFLQIATEFATVGSMLSPSQPIRPVAEDKLAALRRLDKSRAWNSLDDQLYCTGMFDKSRHFRRPSAIAVDLLTKGCG